MDHNTARPDHFKNRLYNLTDMQLICIQHANSPFDSSAHAQLMIIAKLIEHSITFNRAIFLSQRNIAALHSW